MTAKCPPIVYTFSEVYREQSADFLQDPSICHCVFIGCGCMNQREEKKSMKVTKMVIKIEKRSAISGVGAGPNTAVSNIPHFYKV